MALPIFGAPRAPGARPRPHVAVRPASPDDVPLLADLVYQVSARSRYLRYFQPMPASLQQAWAEGRRMARQPANRAVTLVATVPDGAFGAVVAVGELAHEPGSHRGELALLVRDDYQGQGLGVGLGRALVTLARDRGLTELHGDMLPENRAVLRLLQRLGVPVTTGFEDGVIHAVLRLA